MKIINKRWKWSNVNYSFAQSLSHHKENKIDTHLNPFSHEFTHNTQHTQSAHSQRFSPCLSPGLSAHSHENTDVDKAHSSLIRTEADERISQRSTTADRSFCIHTGTLL